MTGHSNLYCDRTGRITDNSECMGLRSMLMDEDRVPNPSYAGKFKLFVAIHGKLSDLRPTNCLPLGTVIFLRREWVYA